MYKKIAGYWRNDIILSEAMMASHCSRCNEPLEWIVWEDGPYGDGRLFDEWGKDDDAFECDNVDTTCSRCGKEYDLGAWYYNPETNNYCLCRPLLPKEAALAEAEDERRRQIEAGQTVMFDEMNP